MIQKTFHNAFEVKVVVDGHIYMPSEEAKICLNCTLPEKYCKPHRCNRYKEEKKKLKNCRR